MIWPLFRGIILTNISSPLGNSKTPKGHFEINWPLVITLWFQKRCQPIALVFQIIAQDQFRFNVVPVYSEDQTVKKIYLFSEKKIESVSLIVWKCPRNRNLITWAIWNESSTIMAIQYLNYRVDIRNWNIKSSEVLQLLWSPQ